MKPKIAVDARYGLRSPRRGVGEYVHQVLVQLARQENPYDLILYGDQSSNPKTVEFFRTIYPVHILNAPNFFLWEQWIWPHAAKKAKILHGTANIGPLRASIPQILTVHDVIEWHRGRDFPGEIPFRHHVSRFYRMNALKYLAPRALRIMTVSEHAKADVIETLRVSSDRVHVTPLAGKYAVLDEVPPYPATEGSYILVLGALDPRKNLVSALKAFAMIRDRAVTLKVVGVEPQGVAKIKAMAQSLGMVQRVEIRTMVSDDELKRLYQNAAAFLYLSRYEGFGLPLLEAMSQGCPVIFARHSSLPEVACQSGIPVDADDVQSIAQHLEQLLADRDLRQAQSLKSLERARQFSWQHTAALTHKVYLKALKEAGGR